MVSEEKMFEDVDDDGWQMDRTKVTEKNDLHLWYTCIFM